MLASAPLFRAEAQVVRNLEFTSAKRSAYMAEPDSCAIRQDALNRLAENLSMVFGIAVGPQQTWKSGPPAHRSFSYSFSVAELTAKEPVNLRTSVGDFSLELGERVCIFGFTGYLRKGKKVDRNFSSLLLSAYRQETELEYNNYPYNFSALKQLSIKEFNKRNWLLMGSGLNYLTKNNPFAARSLGAISAIYAYEALHYAAIIGGTVSSATTNESILLPVVALLSLAFWKGIVMRHFIAPPIFKMNRRILDSGYKLPYELNPIDDYY